VVTAASKLCERRSLLSVRRLFCDNARCERRIFAERLPDVAAPWARKTTRLTYGIHTSHYTTGLTDAR